MGLSVGLTTINANFDTSAAYSSLGQTKVLYATSSSTPRCKSQVPAKETKCLSCFGFLKCADPIHVISDGNYIMVFCRLNIFGEMLSLI